MSQAPGSSAGWACGVRHTLALGGLGLALVLTGCSSPGPRSTTASQWPSTAPASDPVTGHTAYDPKRNDLALFALSLLDTPYTWGGRGPATGFDCSGLVSHVYREATGLPVRGTSADLGQKSRPIDRTRLQPGDLCLVLVDQVQEALDHIAKRIAEDQ